MAVKIQSGTTGGALAAPNQSALTTSTTGGTFPAATAYYYKVTALAPNGESVGSNEQTITTGAGVNSNSITVSWSAVVGATGYRVYRGTAAGGENVYYAPGNVTTYTDTNAASSAGSPPTSSNALVTSHVIFALHYDTVKVINRGGGDLFFTVDGSQPSVNGPDDYVAPANQTTLARILPADVVQGPPSATTVNLISSATVSFTVEGD